MFEFSGHGVVDALIFLDKRFPVEWITEEPPGSLSHVVFALFNACSAGQTFCQAVVNKGAEAAIGFSEDIGLFVSSTWERAFWEYATKKGKSVVVAAKLAVEKTRKKRWYRRQPFREQIQVLEQSMIIVGDTYIYPSRKGKILR